MFYLVVFFILLGLAILEIWPKYKINHKILIGIAWGILVIVAGLRYETGGDWDIFSDLFEQTNPIGKVLTGEGWGFTGKRLLKAIAEIGFTLLCSVIKQFGVNVQVLFFVITLFSITLITKCLKLYTNYVVFGLMIYYSILYFPLDMICIRQSIMVAMCLYAIQYIKKKSFLKYVLIIIVASTFHNTALLMIPLYFLFKARLNNLTMIIIVAIGCILMILQFPYFQKTLAVIYDLAGEGYVRNTIYYYTTESAFTVSKSISIGFFLNLFLFAVFLWKRDDIEKNPYGSIFFNMFWFSLIIYYYGYDLMEISYRLRLSYLISMVILFTYMVDINIKYLRKPVVVSIIVFYCLFFARGVFCDIDKSQVQYIAFNPYQNYVTHKVFNLESTGKERLNEGNRRFKELRDKAIREKK